MPELPEVETICRYLNSYLVGKTITSVTISVPKLIKEITPTLFCKKLFGKRILEVRRRGKYLILELTPKLYLLVHLKLSGRFLFSKKAATKGIPFQLSFSFDDGSVLYYQDVRRFGSFTLSAIDPITELRLGPEPLEPTFTIGRFQKMVSGRASRIKHFLLDQKRIAGLGNIYVTEALFQAGIHPDRRASSLKKEEVKRLYWAIKSVLKRAVSVGGTSIQDYLKPNGKGGRFQEQLFVYRRKGEVCRRCKNRISAQKDGSRTTYFCPKCQV